VKYSLSELVFIAGYTNDLDAANSEKGMRLYYTIQTFAGQYINANLYVKLFAAKEYHVFFSIKFMKF